MSGSSCASTAGQPSSGPSESLQQVSGTSSDRQVMGTSFESFFSSCELPFGSCELSEFEPNMKLDKCDNHVGQLFGNQDNNLHTNNTAAAFNSANSEDLQHSDEAPCSQKVSDGCKGEGGEGRDYLIASASQSPAPNSTNLSTSKYVNRHLVRGDFSGDLINRTVNRSQERVEPVQLFRHKYRNEQLFVIKKQKQ